MRATIRCALLGLLAFLLAAAPPAAAFLDVISRDFQALTRKVTARHILLPKSDDVALALKQGIRNKVSPPRDSGKEPAYVVDAFAAAARKYSRDEETAADGGLLGELVPQGFCSRAKELDRACFEVPLGEVCGPVESEYGYHLLLVQERTNCPKLDGSYTKISRGADGASKVFSGDSDQGASEQIIRTAWKQVGFWAGVGVAGGAVAEMAAKASEMIGTLPLE